MFTSPILCAEMPPTGKALSDFIGAPINSISLWRWQIIVDYPFFVLYGLMFALGGWFRSRNHSNLTLRKTAVVLIVIGSCMDGVENTGLLLAIAKSEAQLPIGDGLAALIRLSAVTKFALLSAGCALGCAFFLLEKRKDRPVRGRFQATFAICLCGLMLVAPFDIRFVEYAFVGILFSGLIFLIYTVHYLVTNRETAEDASAPLPRP